MKGSKIGELSDTYDQSGKLDAFHVPGMLVHSTLVLRAGDRVYFDDNERGMVHLSMDDRSDGVIDPFLATPCVPSQACWMFIKPDLVDNLTHSFDVKGLPIVPAKDESDDDDYDECKGCY